MADRQRPTGKKRAAKPAAGVKCAPSPRSEVQKGEALERDVSGNAAAQNASSPPAAPAARIRALEAERDKLAAELGAAQERIAVLEQAREQVLNRIDWVIDSLHSLTSE